uniref:Uncharacterized protein n=1 Tax=Streptococcus salivarius TaxID=1304 RepID=A0A1R3T4Z3_STRSL|nr:Conserved protein of unknown function [Streptococcus salivarius]SCW20650.1 conserved protein of unknown function [Streptococcus salivarius]SCW20683.1 Conserved protein of unknown function [Streptococcus salivarius]SCW20711.1 conserved protein of unknown function [Streptococcus salivarius]SCW20744.1 conserved protein of unknown function [Streptococcus salivarius]
MTNFFRITM